MLFPTGQLLVIVVVIALALSVQLTVAYGLHLWARAAAKDRRGLWEELTILPLLATIVFLCGSGGSAILLLRAFRVIDAVSPESKARVLAESISEAMNCAALAGAATWVLFIASFVSSAIGSRRR